MNELDLVASLRPAEDLADAGDLAGARRTLTAVLTAPPSRPHGRAYPTRAARSGHLGPVRPWRLLTAVTAASAAGVAIAFAAAGAAPSVIAAKAHPRVHGPAESAVTLTAAQFLTRAAAATRHGRVAVPSPDQYVYSRNVSAGSGWTREWLSVTGSRAGLRVSSGSGPGTALIQPACTSAQAEATGCLLAAGYLPGLPAVPDKILPYLAKLGLAAARPPAGQDTPNWLANDTGKAVADLMSTTYLLPGQQSALFRLLAGTPGFELIPHAVDALGRRGDGIYWSYEGGGTVIVFDPATYRYLGVGTWPANSRPVSPRGLVVAPYGSALMAIALVNTEPSAPRPGAAPGLLRSAKLWAMRQHPGQSWSVAEELAAYLRQVRHMSPAQVRELLQKTLGLGSGPPAG